MLINGSSCYTVCYYSYHSLRPYYKLIHLHINKCLTMTLHKGYRYCACLMRICLSSIYFWDIYYLFALIHVAMVFMNMWHSLTNNIQQNIAQILTRLTIITTLWSEHATRFHVQLILFSLFRYSVWNIFSYFWTWNLGQNRVTRGGAPTGVSHFVGKMLGDGLQGYYFPWHC